MPPEKRKDEENEDDQEKDDNSQKPMTHIEEEENQHLTAFAAKHSYMLSERAVSQAGSLNSHQVPLQHMTHTSNMYSGSKVPVNIGVKTERSAAPDSEMQQPES